MDFVQPTTNTIIFITMFVLVYVTYLLAKIRKNHVDLYDFLFLILVSLLPAAFVYFPESVFWLTQFVGVKFPFIILFGLLIFCIFIQLHRVAIAIYKTKNNIVHLSQKLSFLEDEVQNLKKKYNGH